MHKADDEVIKYYITRTVKEYNESGRSNVIVAVSRRGMLGQDDPLCPQQPVGDSADTTEPVDHPV